MTDERFTDRARTLPDHTVAASERRRLTAWLEVALADGKQQAPDVLAARLHAVGVRALAWDHPALKPERRNA